MKWCRSPTGEGRSSVWLTGWWVDYRHEPWSVAPMLICRARSWWRSTACGCSCCLWRWSLSLLWNVANLLEDPPSLRELAIGAPSGAGRVDCSARCRRSRCWRHWVGLRSILGVVGVLPVLVALAPEGGAVIFRRHSQRRQGDRAGGGASSSVLLVGLLLHWQATRRMLAQPNCDGQGALSGSLKPWIRQALIGAQAALVMMVLAGAAFARAQLD